MFNWISEYSQFPLRLRIANFAMTVLLCVLGLRLWYLQGVCGNYFRDQSENNRTRQIRTLAPRGDVLDREGRLLVGSRPAFDVNLILEDTSDPEGTMAQLAVIAGRDYESLSARLEKQRRNKSPFEPKVILPDVSPEILSKIKVQSYRLPGVVVEIEPVRMYPHHELGAATFGYAREIRKEQLDLMRSDDYKPGDVIGQAGLEKSWESELRGKSGFTVLEVDAHGLRRGERGTIPYQSGKTLELTLDLDLQRAAEISLTGKRGAVVALDPRNGEVLALASSPTVDPNIFASQMDSGVWDEIIKDPDRPLRNRAISETYPPGSTIKLFMAVAGLNEGKINENTSVFCPGYFNFGGRPFKCHKKEGHGHVNLQDAIMLSCNVFFYQLGNNLGIDGISKYGGMFGFGKTTGIQLPGEEAGVLPSAEYKMRTQGVKWYAGETISVAIGQGYWAVTPLQMAVALSSIVNGGNVFEPLLIRRSTDKATGQVKEYSARIKSKVDIKPSTLKEVQAFATEVVNNKRGTGKKAALPGILVGGKTGTAQSAAEGHAHKEGESPDHAWFISFAPADNPTIVLAVIVENSGKGGMFAAPVSRQVMEVYFRKLGFLIPTEEVKSSNEQTVDNTLIPENIDVDPGAKEDQMHVHDDIED